MPVSQQDLTKSVNMFMQKESVGLPTTSDFLEMGSAAWNDGVAIEISTQMKYFCTDCTFAFLIVAEDTDIIELRA